MLCRACMCSYYTLFLIGALTAYGDDAWARGTQRLVIPVSILAFNTESIVVQQRREFLREGIAQCRAGDFCLFFFAIVPTLLTFQMQDLPNMVIHLGDRFPHLVSIDVDIGRSLFSPRTGFQERKE